MKTFAEIETEDRRLVILRLLAQATNYSSNAYLLQAALPGCGHHVSYDRLQTDFDWLEEQGLVTMSGIAGVTIATLTQRGLDVSNGTAHATGVKRPAPGTSH